MTAEPEESGTVHTLPVAQCVARGLVSDSVADRMALKNEEVMKIGLLLEALFQDRFASERVTVLNSAVANATPSFTDEDSVAEFVAELVHPRHGYPQYEAMALRATAMVENAIESTDPSGILRDNGIDATNASDPFIYHAKLTKLYAEVIGGAKGSQRFKAAVKNAGFLIRHGKEPGARVALSGACLGMSLVLSSTPVGPVIAGTKLSMTLFDTPSGQRFQASLKKHLVGFLSSTGVDLATSSVVLKAIGNVWSKVATQKYSRLYLLGSIAALDTKSLWTGLTAVGALGEAIGSAIQYTGESIDNGFLEGLSESAASGIDKIRHILIGEDDSQVVVPGRLYEKVDVPAIAPLTGFVGGAYDVACPIPMEPTSRGWYSSWLGAATDQQKRMVGPLAFLAAGLVGGPQSVQAVMSADFGEAHRVVELNGQSLWDVVKESLVDEIGVRPSETQIINYINMVLEHNGLSGPSDIGGDQAITLPAVDDLPANQISGSVDWLEDSQRTAQVFAPRH